MMWDGGYGWGYGGAGSWIGMGAMMFFALLVLVGVVLLVAWLVRGGAAGGGHHYNGTSAACDIAKQRYARGEITKEQYEEICRTIGV